MVKECVFTSTASTLALSRFPPLGSLQQCGQLLRGECQDDSALGLLPCLRALPQGLQGEDSQSGVLFFCPPAVPSTTPSVPASRACGGENAAPLRLHLCRRTWHTVPGQKKQERPAGSDTRNCSVEAGPPHPIPPRFPLHLPPSSIPGRPRPASPPHTLPGIVLCLDLWDLGSKETQGLLCKCVSVPPPNLKELAGHLEKKWTSGDAQRVRGWARISRVRIYSHI